MKSIEIIICLKIKAKKTWIMEFKMYLNELKQELGKDTDVKSDTVVLKFTPDKKKGRI